MKVVIITGASSGIGLAAAKAFAAKGDCVVLAARNIAKLNSTVAVLGNLHGAETRLEGRRVPRFLAVVRTAFDGTAETIISPKEAASSISFVISLLQK